MAKIPYAFVVGRLMYATICTRLDITHVVGVVSIFMLIQEGSIGNPSSGCYAT